MNGARPYKTFFQTPSFETRPFLKSSVVNNSYRAPWVPTVNRKFSTGRRNFPTAHRKFPTASRKFTTGSTKNHTADMGRKEKGQFPENDKGYWDSGYFRHMTGNISYLADFEPFDGGYVSFGQGGCKITGKGTIKTDSECIVLGRNFKLLDDTNILLRTPRQHNMYSIDLNNIVPHKDLTCLVAKASADECILWHRRLGHLNVKTMNKLVRHSLVRGLPTKSFDNDHTCTACLKGKQHKASCTKDAANQEVKKNESSLRYIVLPNWAYDALLESTSSKPYEESSSQVPEGSGNPNPTAYAFNPSTDQMETLTVKSSISTVSSPVPTACLNDSSEPSSEARLVLKGFANQEETPSLDNILSLTNRVSTSSDEIIGVEADVSNMETSILASPTPTLRIHKDHPKRVRPIGTKWVLKNKKDERGIVVINKARLVAQGHTQEERIDYDEVFAPVARIEAIRLFLAYASFMGFTVYQMDGKSDFLYGTIDEEVYMMQPPGFHDPVHTAKTFDLVWKWLGGDYGNVFHNGY
nr:putative ribonuclease H-like domain-containing protein [Tanacetum cinerariifolium]